MISVVFRGGARGQGQRNIGGYRGIATQGWRGRQESGDPGSGSQDNQTPKSMNFPRVGRQKQGTMSGTNKICPSERNPSSTDVRILARPLRLSP